MTERHHRMAAFHLQHGRPMLAVESLRAVLTEDPDDADAHALLGIVLLQLKRRDAAELEARTAAALAPMNPLALQAMARTAIARGAFHEAEEHVAQLQALLPHDPDPFLLEDDLRRLTGETARREQAVLQALALAPDQPDTLVAAGEMYLDTGRLPQAEDKAREAMALAPDNPSSLLLASRVALQRGDADEAWALCVEVLRGHPDHDEALRLMAGIKARQSPVLGLWWRWVTWMNGLGQARQLAFLLGTFVVYRVGLQLADDSGQEAIGSLVQLLWFGACAYTWFSPAIFQRMVQEELRAVRLDPEF